LRPADRCSSVAKITWPLGPGWDDERLEAALFRGYQVRSMILVSELLVSLGSHSEAYTGNGRSPCPRPALERPTGYATVAPMSIRRVVPDIKSKYMDESKAFYVDFLGLTLAMDMGFVMTFVSPSNATAQISVMRDDGASALLPNVSVEVADVDIVYARAIERRLEIAYPLTDEPWGVRRFFVLDPSGTVLNIMSHGPGKS
jgi:catechol 2,3-dioxygenase-like lactoylglutathione lyase family enzyme